MRSRQKLRELVTQEFPHRIFLVVSRIDLRLYSPDFSIIEENNDFLLVNKPPHLLVHPNKPGNPPTMLDGLEQLYAYEQACGGKLSVMNRLDRETSGIVMVALHSDAASELGKAMERREFGKSYHAIVWGWPEQDHFTVEEPILARREIEETPIWVKQMVHPEGKSCRTEFEVEQRFEKKTSNGDRFSLVKCTLFTGRMHQIRVHLSHAGFPLIGDKMYGPDERCYLRFIEEGWSADLEQKLLLDRQALHASGFSWREKTWTAEMPDDMAGFLDC